MDDDAIVLGQSKSPGQGPIPRPRGESADIDGIGNELYGCQPKLRESLDQVPRGTDDQVDLAKSPQVVRGGSGWIGSVENVATRMATSQKNAGQSLTTSEGRNVPRKGLATDQ